MAEMMAHLRNHFRYHSDGHVDGDEWTSSGRVFFNALENSDMLKEPAVNESSGFHHMHYDDALCISRSFLRTLIHKPTAKMNRMIPQRSENPGGFTLSELYGMRRSFDFLFDTTFGEGVYLKFFLAYDFAFSKKRLYYFAKTLSNTPAKIDITLTTTIQNSTITYSTTAKAYPLREDAPIMFLDYIGEKSLYRFLNGVNNSVSIRVIP